MSGGLESARDAECGSVVWCGEALAVTCVCVKR